ncbi:hypothetical protein ACICHK_04835 [Streptomyces sp. AHU1]
MTKIIISWVRTVKSATRPRHGHVPGSRVGTPFGVVEPAAGR